MTSEAVGNRRLPVRAQTSASVLVLKYSLVFLPFIHSRATQPFLRFSTQPIATPVWALCGRNLHICRSGVNTVEVGGFEPPCSGDRPGLLRAQPGGEISPRGSHRRRTSRPARVRCPVVAPERNHIREPAHDARPPGAGTLEGAAT